MSDIILNTVLKLLRSQGFCHLMLRKLECTGRARECGSDVELDDGTVDTTGLVRRASLDVGTSNIDRQTGFGNTSIFCDPSPHDEEIISIDINRTPGLPCASRSGNPEELTDQLR